MARDDEFHERFIKVVEGHIRDGGKRTDVAIAKLLCCCRQTVIAWRKKYPEFQKAIDSPNARINSKVNRNIEAMLDEGTICIVEDGNGKVTKKVKTQLAPEAVNAAIKAGFGGTNTFNEREQKQRDAELTRTIRLRMQKDELSYLDAVDECEEEGIPIPESWKRHELGRIIRLKTSGEITALEAAQLLESEGIAVPKTLMLEVQKSIGIIDTEVVHPPIIQFAPCAGEKSNDDDNNSQD